MKFFKNIYCVRTEKPYDLFARLNTSENFIRQKSIGALLVNNLNVMFKDAEDEEIIPLVSHIASKIVDLTERLKLLTLVGVCSYDDSRAMAAAKALIVKDKMIISTGYNGSPKGIKHCTEGGCKRCTLRHLGKMKSGVYQEPCICCHSEENAIVQAAYNGSSTKGAIMYTTFTPCTTCAKMIINSGIKEVVAKVKYPDEVGTKLLKDAGVVLRVLE